MRHIYTFIFLTLTCLSSLYAKEQFKSPVILSLADSTITPYSGGVLPVDKPGEYELITSFEIDNSIIHPAFFIAPFPFPVVISINGEQIYSWGDGGNTKFMANYSAVALTLPDKLIKDSNRFVLRFYTDGTQTKLPDFWIGEKISAQKRAFWQTLLNFSIIRAIVLIALFSTLLLLFYYFFSERKEKLTLILSIFSLSVAGGYSIFIFNNYWFDEVTLFKIARSFHMIMSFTLIYFVSELTGYFKNRLLKYVIACAFLPYVVLTILSSSKMEINYIFNMATHTAIMPLLLIGVGMLSVAAIKRGETRARVMLAAYSVFIFTAFSDLFSQINFEIPFFWKIPYGYAFLLLTGMIVAIADRVKNQKQITDECIAVKAQLQRFDTEQQQTTELIVKLTHYIEHSVSALDNYLMNNLDGFSDCKYPEIRGFIEYIRGIKFGKSFLVDINDESEIWYDSFNLLEHLESFIAFYRMRDSDTAEKINFNIEKENIPNEVWADKAVMFRIYDITIFLCQHKEHLINYSFSYHDEELLIDLTIENSTLTSEYLHDICTIRSNEKLYSNQFIKFLHKLILLMSGTINCNCDNSIHKISIVVPIKRVGK